MKGEKKGAKKGAKKNILLLFGGGSTEHEISVISARHIWNCLKDYASFSVYSVEMDQDKKLWLYPTDWDDIDRLQKQERIKKTIEVEFGEEGGRLSLNLSAKNLSAKNLSANPNASTSLQHISTATTVPIDMVIPCFHGHPGETGDIQSWFELKNIAYLGSGPESSRICFNKLNTKIWLGHLGIPNTPFIALYDQGAEELEKATTFFRNLKLAGRSGIFIKASHQGSSVGCFKVEREEEIRSAIATAFTLSPYVLIEEMIIGRELEVSVYQYQGKHYASDPGEIVAPDHFYSFQEKYSKNSKTQTIVRAVGLTQDQINLIKDYSLLAFKALKLRHLARVDFLLSTDGQIFLNEINSFPGLTPISMFPKMMEENGHKFFSFIVESIREIVG